MPYQGVRQAFLLFPPGPYEVLNVGRTDGLLKGIVGNPVAMEAFRAGIPGNGKPLPNGTKRAKIHGQGCEAIRGQWRMGLCGVRACRRVRHVPAPAPRPGELHWLINKLDTFKKRLN
jgi:hypothetical protein